MNNQIQVWTEKCLTVVPSAGQEQEQEENQKDFNNWFDDQQHKK